MPRHLQRFLALALLAPCWLGTAIAASESAPRFRPLDDAVPGSAAWASYDVDRIAVGDGRRLTVLRTQPRLAVERELELDRLPRAALLVEHLLYFHDGAGIVRVAIDGPSEVQPVVLDPAPGNAVRLGKIGKFLLVAEDDVGLRAYRFPAMHEAGHGHAVHDGEDPAHPFVGELRLPHGFRALTAGSGAVYLATADGAVLEIDAVDPGRLTLVRTLAVGAPVRALAANGTTLYLLGEAGVQTVELDSPDSPRLHAALRGNDLALAGRLLYLAEPDGVRTWRDATRGSIQHRVDLRPISFDPQFVSLDPGDSVFWVNPASYDPPDYRGGATLHSVRSCDPTVIDCSGTAVEPFGNGGPSVGPWTYTFFFTMPGENPYVCEVHSSVGMTGTVTVVGAAAPPPGVPDGVSGSPLLLGKADATGSALSVSWDTATCTDAVDHQILWGGASQLPASPGGTYGVDGSACAIGAGSPFTWNASPDPTLDPLGWIWVLVVATDGTTTEGPWGSGLGGLERAGPGADGSSGQCGIATKDLTNLCGQ